LLLEGGLGRGKRGSSWILVVGGFCCCVLLLVVAMECRDGAVKVFGGVNEDVSMNRVS